MIKRLLAYTVLIFCFTTIFAQTRIDSVAFRAMQVGQVMQQERVYLHFDNSAYYLGETIWFKAYVTFGKNNRPSTLSKVLYVELVAPEGYVVETKKYRLNDDGCCYGEFELSPLILSGYYEIRAYTRYMLNWDKEAIFSRVFPIFDRVNADNWDFKNMLDRNRGFMKEGKWVSSELPEATLDFFPEGGHLIEGIESRVAYELRETDGLFSEEKIHIYENGNKLTESTPVHQGKGTFYITPKTGAKYHAEVYVKSENGKSKKHKFDLPEVSAEGATIQITENGDSIHIDVRQNFTDEKELGFAILHQGAMGYFKKKSSKEKNINFTFHKSELPEGICRALLFIDGNLPLTERQFFVMHDTPGKDDIPTVRLKVTANGYFPENLSPEAGEKITLKIKREDGKPIQAGTDLSLSIKDAAAAQKTSYTHNFYTWLLLGSELKGYIPNAIQYFDTTNGNRKRDLDLVMLTHGWTSYDWQMLTRPQIDEIQPIERGITLKGKFFMKRRSDDSGSKGNTIIVPQKYNLTRLDIATDGKQVETTSFRTDSTGSFVIELDDFNGTRIASLRPQTVFKHSANISYQFALDRYYSPGYRLYDYWERHLGTVMGRNTSDSIVRMNPFEYMLSSVEVVGKRNKELNSRPPHSEMRFNYLDEWEYAQDVTYLDQFNTYEDDVYQSVIDQASTYPVPEDGKFPGTPMEAELFANVNYDAEEIVNIYDKKRIATKYIGRMRVSSDSSRTVMTVDHEYDHTLTAADVVSSAMRRHNYNWAYWTQLMVVKGEYNSQTVPAPDHEYVRGLPDVDKMTRFKEFVIRCDEKTRAQFENRDTHWARLSTMLDNKRPVSKFYLGFLSQMYLYPGSGIDGSPDSHTFFSSLMNNTGITNPINPNYVACMIPYNENDSTGIIPEFAATGSSLRYTSIQGYSNSKKFYSPDYGKMKPQNADYRRTLLWVPQITIEDGEATVELYNSSVCNNIEVSVEGRNGRILFDNNPNTQTRIHPDVENHRTATNTGVSNIKDEAPMDSVMLAQCAHEQEKGEILYNQRRYRDAITIFAELVKYNYPPALYYVGRCYKDGTGINKNPKLSLKFYLEAAKRDYAKAQYELARIIDEGEWVERDESLALSWYSKAAEQNEPMALIEMARRYAGGILVEQDDEMCEDMLRRAAELQHPDGLFEYGIYLTNHNHNGIEYINAAAELKHEKALLYMLEHEHSAGNFKKAYKHAKELSLLGNNYGTKCMADYYMEGKGVSKDRQLAKDLYREAANAGNSEAAEILKKL